MIQVGYICLKNIRHWRIVIVMQTVIELSPFNRNWSAVWSEGEYNEFIKWIAANSKSGDVIKGSGGVRKIRWASSGHGKRGGARVIFYSANTSNIYLMTIYAKNQQSDISAKELKIIKELIE